MDASQEPPPPVNAVEIAGERERPLIAARMGAVTLTLICMNVAVYGVDLGLRVREAHGGALPTVGPLTTWGCFTIQTAIARFQIWRTITSQFLHAGWAHLAANMIGLYIFGPVVEAKLGRRRYLFFYVLCGIAGTLMFTLLWALGILIPHIPLMIAPQKADAMLIGASGSIFGVLVAAAYLCPEDALSLGAWELPLRNFALVMIGVALYTVLVHGPDAGGQAAHLGGALLGWLLIRSLKRERALVERV